MCESWQWKLGSSPLAHILLTLSTLLLSTWSLNFFLDALELMAFNCFSSMCSILYTRLLYLSCKEKIGKNKKKIHFYTKIQIKWGAHNCGDFGEPGIQRSRSKFIFSKKVTKFEKSSPSIWCLLHSVKLMVRTLINFCGLLRKHEL